MNALVWMESESLSQIIFEYLIEYNCPALPLDCRSIVASFCVARWERIPKSAGSRDRERAIIQLIVDRDDGINRCRGSSIALTIEYGDKCVSCNSVAEPMRLVVRYYQPIDARGKWHNSKWLLDRLIRDAFDTGGNESMEWVEIIDKEDKPVRKWWPPVSVTSVAEDKIDWYHR